MTEPVGEQTQLQALIAWLDQQSLRERLLIVGLGLAAIVVIWSELLMAAVDSRRVAAEEQLAPLAAKIKILELEIGALAKRVKLDPNEVKRDTLTALLADLENTHGALEKRTADLIPPSEMTSVVRELLGKESSLALLRMETLEPEPLLSSDAEIEGLEVTSTGDQVDALYKHSLSIELSGDFMATLRWLQTIEEIQWRFFWDDLVYSVEEYPVARVKVVLHSLSEEEDWIGG